MELMLVMGIVAALVAMLIPAIKILQMTSKQMICANQQRNIGLYIHSYLNDNEGSFFQGNNILSFNSTNDTMFKMLVICPEGNKKYSASGSNTTIGYNGAFLGGCISSGVLARPAHIAEIVKPAETVLAGCSNGTCYLEYFACTAAIWPWHRRGYAANVLAVDGHVQSFTTSTAYDNTDLYRPVFQGGLGDALTNGPYRNYTWHDRN